MRRSCQDTVHFPLDDITLAEIPNAKEGAEYIVWNHEKAIDEHDLRLRPAAQRWRMLEDD
ncbi:hypothetical protein D3C80_1824280 [compost metagenome]